MRKLYFGYKLITIIVPLVMKIAVKIRSQMYKNKGFEIIQSQFIFYEFIRQNNYYFIDKLAKQNQVITEEIKYKVKEKVSMNQKIQRLLFLVILKQYHSTFKQLYEKSSFYFNSYRQLESLHVLVNLRFSGVNLRQLLNKLWRKISKEQTISTCLFGYSYKLNFVRKFNDKQQQIIQTQININYIHLQLYVQIPCLNGHEENVDFFCISENCKDNRFYCFNQCIKSDHKHAHNDKDLYKIEEFPNYLLKSNTQLSELIKDLDKIFEDLSFLFKQLKYHLFYTFEWTLDRIKWLRGKNINIALDNIIKLEEYKKSFIINLQQHTQMLSHILNKSIQELQLKEVFILHDQQKGAQQFYLLKQCQIKEKEVCKTIVLNQDSSTIICGFESCIKIYEFKQQSIQEIKIIKKNYFKQILFINNTDKFICLFTNYMAIYSKVNTNWQQQQSFDFCFNQYLDLMTIMKDESFVVLRRYYLRIGNRYGILFFQKINEQYQVQDEYSIDRLNLYINSDMNDSENTIILCREQMIDIIQRQCQTKKWDTLQQIKIQEDSPSAKFIQDNSFIASKHSLLCIYSINSNNQLFEKKREINFQSGRIISNTIQIKQFLKSQQFLLISINYKLNIYKVDENGDLRIEYGVECDNYQGMISKNGKILITQDLDSKQISIRQILE